MVDIEAMKTHVQSLNEQTKAVIVLELRSDGRVAFTSSAHQLDQLVLLNFTLSRHINKMYDEFDKRDSNSSVTYTNIDYVQ